MKISSSWLKTAGTRRTLASLQYREIERIEITGENQIMIFAEGLPRHFENRPYREEPQKLVIVDLTDADLIDLHLQIERVLLGRVKSSTAAAEDEEPPLFDASI